MSKLLVLFSLWSLTSFAQANTLDRGGAELLNAKAYSVGLQASVFDMSAHLDDLGVEIPKTEGSSYRLIDTDFKLSYGLSSNLETSILARYRNVSSSDGTESGAITNSGPESIGVEAKYSFPKINFIQYALGVHYRQTLYTNTKYTTSEIPPTTEIILGDDGSEYGISLYATYTNSPWKLDFELGYNSPANELSSEVVYKAEATYHFSKLGLIAGLEGISSLKKDQFTNDPTLKPLMSEGQSNLFNSLNRSKTAPYIGLNYSFDKFLIGIKGQSVISGISTDKGSSVMGFLTWNSFGETPESVKVNTFKEYHVEGSVLKVSARGNFIKIDQGLGSDIEKGAKFDIYQTDYFGGNVLVASGIAYEVGADWSVIKITKRFNEIAIKPGFAARGY